VDTVSASPDAVLKRCRRRSLIAGNSMAMTQNRSCVVVVTCDDPHHQISYLAEPLAQRALFCYLRPSAGHRGWPSECEDAPHGEHRRRRPRAPLPPHLRHRRPSAATARLVEGRSPGGTAAAFSSGGGAALGAAAAAGGGGGALPGAVAVEAPHERDEGVGQTGARRGRLQVRTTLDHLHADIYATTFLWVSRCTGNKRPLVIQDMTALDCGAPVRAISVRAETRPTDLDAALDHGGEELEE
jgi:hypothetical protein